MKYIISIVLIAGLFFVGAYSKAEQSKLNEIHKSLDGLNQKHGNLLFVAFFSVEETRPFSINQFDKTLDLYGKTFTSGKTYLSTLNEEDFKKLKIHIANYIEDKEIEERKDIFEKLDYWCTVKKEFDLIEIEYGVPTINILKALYENNKTKSAFDDIIKLGPFKINKLNSNQSEEIFNNAINRLATKSKREQFQYYSYLFESLAGKI